MSGPNNNDSRESYVARHKAEHLYWAQIHYELKCKETISMWIALMNYAMSEDLYGDHWDKLKEKNNEKAE